jgi:ParB family chromosome partitioning protein
MAAKRKGASMTVIDVPLSQIDLGTRRRQDYGDMAALAKGIARVGLLEPIVVDRNGQPDRYRLVAGGRRLAAARMLRWENIPALVLGELTEQQLREIELEENENRKALTEQERARTFGSNKQRLENARRAAEIISSTAEEKDPRGRRAIHGAPKAAIAEALGISTGTLVNTEHHVQIAEQFPWMQGNVWRQSDVLRVHERLTETTPEARAQIIGVLNCSRLLDPELTVTLIENLVAKKPGEREAIYQLSQSDDPREQSLALTRAADKPPMPDPRLGILDRATDCLNAAIRPFPRDPLTPRLIQIRQEIRSVRAAVKQVSYDAQREKQEEAVQ